LRIAIRWRYCIVCKVEASSVIVTIVALCIRGGNDKADVYGLGKDYWLVEVQFRGE
jgi:hypothetical protein